MAAIVALGGLCSLDAGAQTVSAGGSGTIGGPNATAPSGAAITHTPGTPGASDTPGVFQASHARGSAPGGLSRRELRALKKQAEKAASSAPSSK